MTKAAFDKIAEGLREARDIARGDGDPPPDPGLPLGYAEQKNPPPRPSDRDEKVRLAAIQMILPEVIQWVGDEFKEHQKDELVENLLFVLGESDGYRAARKLECDRGWDPDEDLVEVLSGLSSCLSDVCREAVKRWADANQIKPKLKVGDVVSAPRFRIAEGTITNIRHETAEYVVTTPDFFRRNPAALGGGTLVPFELAQLCKAEAREVAA